MSQQRKARVEHALRDVLTKMIATDVRDPRVKEATLITVAKVELNVDLSVAKVYVSVIGDERMITGALAGLGKAAGFLRGPVGRELSLNRPPELRFVRDVSIDMGERIGSIIREDEDRARAAGREPAPSPSSVPPRPTAPPPAEPDDAADDEEPAEEPV
jgi:ribosome-binding factor A